MRLDLELNVNPAMASSRIFVKGLPPTFTEADFRKHFSQNREITDAKIFPSRRIGYVGYRTPEDAQKAVKYFNMTFIKMSRIGVEIARPVQDANVAKQNVSGPTARQSSGEDYEASERNKVKRKRKSEDEDVQDPKLKEFLDVMKPRSKKKAWDNEDSEMQLRDENVDNEDDTMAVVDGKRDEEYAAVPKKVKRSRTEVESIEMDSDTPTKDRLDSREDANLEPEPDEGTTAPSPNDRPAVSDSDWARSRTSRLLGLLDDDEEEAAAQWPNEEDHAPSEDDMEEPEKGTLKKRRAAEPVSSIPTPPADVVEEGVSKPASDADAEPESSTMRLFLRNLPYDIKAEDLEEDFASYGSLEKVGFYFTLSFCLEMNPDRDSLCYGI